MQFGLLHELARCARYWYRPSRHSAACLLSYEEYTAKAALRLPQRGIVELFGHTARLAWPSAFSDANDFVQVCVQNVRFPAVFVSRSNSSTLFAALEGADPSLALDSLLKLTAHVAVVVIFIGSLAPRQGRRLLVSNAMRGLVIE